MNDLEKPLVYILLLVGPPLLGLLSHLAFCNDRAKLGATLSTCGIWFAFINAMAAWFVQLPFFPSESVWGLRANEISWVMATLILFISAVVHQFSIRYMAGDRLYRRYFLTLNFLTISALLMVAFDHVILLLIFWGLSNGLLVLLMMHKSDWLAAKGSAILSLKTLMLGLVFLSGGIALLAFEANTLSLETIIAHRNISSNVNQFIALLLIILAALAQSGGWPFHRWLLSSLNSPTPVSALMHAGLVNGGGFILVCFAPILLRDAAALSILFLFASITLTLGGMWKLMQADVKRMLACSTMTQLGFMLMQCGLGFFPAALAHLCWHGLFKAYLFLRSGSAIQDNLQSNETSNSSIVYFLCSGVCGAMGVAGFIWGTRLYPHALDTSCVLLFFCWLASTQLALTLLGNTFSFFSITTACCVCLGAGVAYGLTVEMIENAVRSMHIDHPQPLNGVHIAFMIFIFGMWLALNVKPFHHYAQTILWKRLYVIMLNASQPHPATVTVKHNRYQF